MSPLVYLCLFVCITLIHSTKTAEIQNAVGNATGFRPHVHKYLVLLRIYDDGAGFLCSGSIIDKEWIISAAHCFAKHQYRKIKIIRKIDSNEHVLGFVSKYANHPKFDITKGSKTAKYDLALLKTRKPIQLSEFIKPIALARLGAFGQKGIIAGYASKTPLEGAVVVNRCKWAPSDDGLLCSPYWAYAQNGDSGGALTTSNGLVGVISLRVGSETVYVNISLHFDYIQKVTGKKLHKK
ncbi:hypothetical protein PYW08_008743 [Mythimna loreyi]|uniref:Uncharacterized protein n=1 Tax=Mythimna loreyi TaxID=667449 RepID=A0ACC2QBB6_9NEOP|nr:hypothetical protein PYW08_008743 [Mythimna loreyi]